MQQSMLLLLLLLLLLCCCVVLLSLPTVDVSSVQGEHACRARRTAAKQHSDEQQKVDSEHVPGRSCITLFAIH
jgi:hypothetical protein